MVEKRGLREGCLSHLQHVLAWATKGWHMLEGWGALQDRWKALGILRKIISVVGLCVCSPMWDCIEAMKMNLCD